MTINVMVVEDSKEMQSALRGLFSTLGGFKVLATASSETEATELLFENQGEWQVVTLDLLLAEGSGFNLIYRAKSYRRSGKVVVLSAFVTPVIKKKCLDMGADAVFSKADSNEFSAYMATLAEPAARPRPRGNKLAE